MSTASIWYALAAWSLGLLVGRSIPDPLVAAFLLAAAGVLLRSHLSRTGRHVVLLTLIVLAAAPISRSCRLECSLMTPPGAKAAGDRLRNPHYRPLVTLPDGGGRSPDVDDHIGRLPPGYSDLVGNLVKGVLFNRREALDRSWRDAFRNAGAAHLLAVSGLHMSILVAAGFTLLRVARSGRRLTAIAVTAAVWVYVVSIGSPPSAVRAALMISLAMALRGSLRRMDVGRILPAALLAALVADPSLLGSTGFQMSAAAVGGIVIAGSRVGEGRSIGWLARACRLSIGAQAGVLPIQIAVFGTMTPLALPVNLAAVPLLTLWLPATMAALMLAPAGGPAATIAVAISENLGRILLWWIRLGGMVPGMLQATPAWAAAAGAVGLAAWAAGKRWRLPSLLCLAAVIWSPALDRGLPRITFLDVGQGDAAVIETRRPERIIVVDAGPARGGWDAGEQVVAAYLRSRGVKRIDLLIASHSDTDHTGGMLSLLERFEVVRFVRGAWKIGSEGQRLLLARIRAGGIPEVVPGAGDRLVLARQAVIDVLGGMAPGHRGAGSENDRSLVLRLTLGGLSVLLPGDLEISGERSLQPYSSRLPSRVLKVAHHGGGDSTSPRFLAAVTPEVAVISVGRNNRHGHPDPRLEADLGAAGIRVWRTDLRGALLLRPRR